MIIKAQARLRICFTYIHQYIYTIIIRQFTLLNFIDTKLYTSKQYLQNTVMITVQHLISISFLAFSSYEGTIKPGCTSVQSDQRLSYFLSRAGPRGVDYGGALEVEGLNRAAQAASGERRRG